MAARVYRDQLKEKRRKNFLLKLFLITGLVFLCLAGAVYLLFFANLLDLRSIDVSGAEIIPAAELKAAAESWLDAKFLGVARSRDLLFISSEKLGSELAAGFPRIDAVEVKKEFPHGIKISITERKPAGIWCLPAQAGFPASGKCFFFDENGIAYAEAGQSSGFLILTVADYQDKEIALGSPVVSEEWLNNIMVAKETLPKIGIDVAEFTIPSGSFDEFDAKTAQGWKIMFSNSTDVAKQISSLNVLLRDKLSASKKAALQYIDLRIQDRIYYR